MTIESPTFRSDLAKGRWDVEYFARRFLGVRLHPGQVRFARTVLARNKTGWRAAYLTICLSAGNRGGKSLCLAICMVHACIYKLGKKPPDGSNKDLERWLKSSFQAYHFGIRQEVAELVYWELVKLFSGTHEAQKDGDGCPLANEIPNIATWDKKYQGEYRWFVFSPMIGGAEIHFRTTMEKALGSLGRDMDLITFDECAFDDHLEFIVTEVLTLRRLGTGGQLLLVSTPTAGITQFADYWESGNPESPDRHPDRMSVRMSSRENIGFGLEQEMFDRQVADYSPELVPQNVDGFFIEGKNNYFGAMGIDAAFKDDLPELQAAEHRHAYAQGVDAASTYDSTWSIVLDCTKEVMVGVKVARLRGRQTTESIVALTADSHNAYTVTKPDLRASCSTAIDATGWGGKMFREALGGISPLRNVEFGGSKQKKLKLLGDVKSAIDQGKLILPRSGLWLVGRRQLAGYKLADRSMENDFVMALACAVSEGRRNAGGESAPVEFNPFVPEVPRKTTFWPDTEN